MTDNEKIPYIQCLYHTGKKVYKYWLAGLAIIGVIIGLGLVVSSAWKQIVDFATTIGNIFGSMGYVLTSLFNNAWSLLCTIPWYWWVAIGVIAGPFVLVAIWCALKHFNITIKEIFLTMIVLISVLTVWGMYNCVYEIINLQLTIFGFFFGIFSVIWWVFILIHFDLTTDGGRV